MTDPVSVLLIIGAAVVGPIQALPPRRIETPGTYSYCVRKHGGIKEIDPQRHIDVCVPLPPEPSTGWETFAEVCERAMREIGAKEGATDNIWAKDDELTWLPNGKWYVGNQPVLCIPAPTGLRK